MQAKVKIAVIGSGRISYSHLEAINKLKDKAELIATVDINEKIAKGAAEKFGAKKYYTSMEDALVDPEINSVVICLPHYLHKTTCIQAAEMGKNILIEKPLTNTSGEAEEVIAAAKKNKIILMVGQSQRYYDAVIKSKEIITSGEIGKIINISVSLLGYVDTPPTKWWSSEEKTGGLLIPLWGAHIIDYILWIKNEFPSRLYAECYSRNPNWEGEDEASILMGFKDGTMISIVMSYNTITSHVEAEGNILPFPQYNRYIIGEKGSLHLFSNTELSMNCKELIQGDQKPSVFYIQMNNFIKTILENKEPSPSGEEILNVIKLMEASRTSAKKHKLIEFF